MFQISPTKLSAVIYDYIRQYRVWAFLKSVYILKIELFVFSLNGKWPLLVKKCSLQFNIIKSFYPLVFLSKYSQPFISFINDLIGLINQRGCPIICFIHPQQFQLSIILNSCCRLCNYLNAWFVIIKIEKMSFFCEMFKNYLIINYRQSNYNIKTFRLTQHLFQNEFNSNAQKQYQELQTAFIRPRIIQSIHKFYFLMQNQIALLSVAVLMYFQIKCFYRAIS